MNRIIEFEDLPGSNLHIDAIYKRGPQPNYGGEPLAKLMNVGIRGGFRFRRISGRVRYVVLYSTMENLNWPDEFDFENGLFFYYGDRSRPVQTLEDGKQIWKEKFIV